MHLHVHVEIVLIVKDAMTFTALKTRHGVVVAVHARLATRQSIAFAPLIAGKLAGAEVGLTIGTAATHD